MKDLFKMISRRGIIQSLIFGVTAIDLHCLLRAFLACFDFRRRVLDNFRTLFQDGILNELLLNLIDQLQFVQSEQAHDLNEARRQDLFLLNF